MKIVCEFSGGADSVYATILTKKRWPGAEIIGVFVNYGQVCATQELLTATKAAKKLDIELHIINLKNVWKSGGMINGETKDDTDVYTPLRNLAMLGSVIAFTDSIESDIVITGSKGLSKVEEEDHSYYDSTISFYKLMEGVWYYTTELKREVRIIPILAEGRNTKMTKEEVYRGLLKNGFNYEDTWSCFRGGVKECGKCFNCKIKMEIFEKIER